MRPSDRQRELLHLVIDLGKSFTPPELTAFLADQAAHLVVLIAVAGAWPGLWDAGWWSGTAWLPPVMVLLAGAVLAIRPGGIAVGLLLAPWSDEGLEGLPRGGRIIGNLERGLIYLLVLTGQPGGIGFLIAAKSVLRFGTVRDEARRRDPRRAAAPCASLTDRSVSEAQGAISAGAISG